MVVEIIIKVYLELLWETFLNQSVEVILLQWIISIVEQECKFEKYNKTTTFGTLLK